MGLEDYYLGDRAFADFSAAFCTEWDAFPHKDDLLLLVSGDVQIARPIAFHCGSLYSDWLRSKIPALDDITPLECLSTPSGIRRLKSCLMRMH